MGKNLSNSELVMRTGKLAFYRVPGDTAYTRMEGFTDLSTSKNAKEYNRQYVDEETERTDTTGYGTSIAYALDRYNGNSVIDDIVQIHENERIGQDAVRSIIQVDMPCRPCSIYGSKPCSKGDYPCLREISPEKIVNKVKELLFNGQSSMYKGQDEAQ